MERATVLIDTLRDHTIDKISYTTECESVGLIAEMLVTTSTQSKLGEGLSAHIVAAAGELPLALRQAVKSRAIDLAHGSGGERGSQLVGIATEVAFFRNDRTTLLRRRSKVRRQPRAVRNHHKEEVKRTEARVSNYV